MNEDEMYRPHPRRNAMMTAALVCGIASLVTVAVIYISMPLGALAILFGILSRTESRMATRGKIGIVCGLAGLLLTITVTIGAMHHVFTDPDARSYLEYMLQIYTGDPDLELGDILPFLREPSGEAPHIPEDRYQQPDPAMPGQHPIISPEEEGGFI